MDGLTTARQRDLDAAEEWFGEHGLPWFVDGVDTRVAALVGRRRMVPVLAVAVLAGIVLGTLVGRATQDVGTGAILGVIVALGLLLLYAGGPLRVGTMARWAIRGVISELSLLLPLAVRALPLLLLFMTFLFINTEVWQVAGPLASARVWLVVLVFGAVGTTFLLIRLPEEVRRVERAVAGDGLAKACQGTPLAARARELDPPDGDLLGGLLAGETRGGVVGHRPAVGIADLPPLSQAQRTNLVLVLLVTQAFQVSLLALAVFAFFVLFGALTITRQVITTWVGAPAPTALEWAPLLPVSHELANVSLFLSAFAGLYFTVYAVSDPGYRSQFFAHLDAELEQAVGVRTVYRHLLAHAG